MATTKIEHVGGLIGRQYAGKLNQGISSYEYAMKIFELLKDYESEFRPLLSISKSSIRPNNSWEELIKMLVFNSYDLSPNDIKKYFRKYLNHNFKNIYECYKVMFVIAEHQIIRKALDQVIKNGMPFEGSVPISIATVDGTYIKITLANDWTSINNDPVKRAKAYKEYYHVMDVIKGPYGRIEIDSQRDEIIISLTEEGMDNTELY